MKEKQVLESIHFVKSGFRIQNKMMFTLHFSLICLLNSIENSPLITSLEANSNFQLNSIVILQARARPFRSLQLERAL